MQGGARGRKGVQEWGVTGERRCREVQGCAGRCKKVQASKGATGRCNGCRRVNSLEVHDVGVAGQVVQYLHLAPHVDPAPLGVQLLLGDDLWPRGRWGRGGGEGR